MIQADGFMMGGCYVILLSNSIRNYSRMMVILAATTNRKEFPNLAYPKKKNLVDVSKGNLVMSVSLDEVKATPFAMGAFKVPGPDGYDLFLPKSMGFGGE